MSSCDLLHIANLPMRLVVLKMAFSEFLDGILTYAFFNVSLLSLVVLHNDRTADSEDNIFPTKE